MLLIPCIDLRDGNCVRLERGNFKKETIYENDPIKQAQLFYEKGCRWVHIVDLDGARGQGNNLPIIEKIKKDTKLKVQVGGGLRNQKILKELYKLSIDRMILGTKAVEDFDFAKQSYEYYGEKIAISLDCKGQEIFSRAWENSTNINLFKYIDMMKDCGIKNLIYTDIERDGMRTGPNIKILQEIKKVYSYNIIAAGGISSMDDVKIIDTLGIYGAITGRAVYEKNISLEEIVAFNEVSHG